MAEKILGVDLSRYQERIMQVRPFAERFNTPVKYALGAGILTAVVTGSIGPAVFILGGLGYLVGYTKQVGDSNRRARS